MKLRNFWMTTLLLTLGVTSAQAKKEKYAVAPALTPEQNALIKKAIAAEKLTIKGIQQKSPLVQTYIQNMKGDTKLYAVPVSDQYMLQRVDFAKSFYGKSYSTGEASELCFSSQPFSAIFHAEYQRRDWLPFAREHVCRRAELH